MSYTDVEALLAAKQKADKRKSSSSRPKKSADTEDDEEEEENDDEVDESDESGAVKRGDKWKRDKMLTEALSSDSDFGQPK